MPDSREDLLRCFRQTDGAVLTGLVCACACVSTTNERTRSDGDRPPEHFSLFQVRPDVQGTRYQALHDLPGQDCRFV